MASTTMETVEIPSGYRYRFKGSRNWRVRVVVVRLAGGHIAAATATQVREV